MKKNECPFPRAYRPTVAMHESGNISHEYGVRHRKPQLFSEKTMSVSQEITAERQK
jgi:hypothetical protein